MGKGIAKRYKGNDQERKKGRFPPSVSNICTGCSKHLIARNIPQHKCQK